jgi:PmbA protein
MTKQEKYNLAVWAMEHALKKGAQQCGVIISNSISNNIEVRNEKIDTLKQAIQNSLSIRLFVDRKYSVHSTNRLDKQKLAQFIEEAVSGTRYLTEDEFRTLPDPDLYYKGDQKNLHTLDPGFENYKTEEKIDLAFRAEKEALGQDERIISVTAGYNDSLSKNILVTSNEFRGDSGRSYYGLSASVSVQGDNARPESHWGESAIFFNKLQKNEIGSIALRRALRKIGQRKISSAKIPMIVENRQVSRIFSPLVSALNGSAIQQKNSFLVDKKGEKVFSNKLSVIDDPFIISGRGSRLFDGEGLATKKRIIIENGILRNYYIDTYYAKKLNMQPTNGSTNNLVFNTGDKDLELLIKEAGRCILVNNFNGGNCNGATGDFSYGIDGILIENEEMIQPVSEMNITGNMRELWSNIIETGNDIYANSSWLTPSILFDGVNFSGL